MNKAQDTKKERLSKSFQEISEHVSKADRIEACSKFNVVDMTIKRHLNGELGDFDKAKEMFDFFRTRIIERANQMKKLVA